MSGIIGQVIDLIKSKFAGTVEGTIKNKEGEPIENALVIINDKRTYTDKNGEYEIEVESGTYDIEVSSFEHFPSEKAVAVERFSTKFVNFELEEADGKVIRNWNDLNKVRDYLDEEFTMIKDLDEETEGYSTYFGSEGTDGEETEIKGWEPIGDSRNSFTGNINGNQKEINGMIINRSGEEDVGLFAVNDGEIRNLKVKDADVTGLGGQTNGTGIIAGVNTGTIYDVDVEGNVTGEKINTGGIVGRNDGQIDDVHVIGSINGMKRVGGVAGQNYGRIVNIESENNITADDGVAGGIVGYNRGEVKGGNIDTTIKSGDGKVGGVVGENKNGEIAELDVNVSVDSPKMGVGGAVGENKRGNITNLKVIGDITGLARVGGLIGKNKRGKVKKSNVNVDVKGGGRRIGGMIGDNRNGDIVTSTARGSVIGDESDVGGLIGENKKGDIKRSKVKDMTVECENKRAGGLIGKNNRGRIIGSSADGEVKGFAKVGGLVGYNDNGEIKESDAECDIEGDEFTDDMVGDGSGGIGELY